MGNTRSTKSSKASFSLFMGQECVKNSNRYQCLPFCLSFQLRYVHYLVFSLFSVSVECFNSFFNSLRRGSSFCVSVRLVRTGIREVFPCGIRNPPDKNPESKFHWQRLESRKQDSLGFPFYTWGERRQKGDVGHAHLLILLLQITTTGNSHV